MRTSSQTRICCLSILYPCASLPASSTHARLPPFFPLPPFPLLLSRSTHSRSRHSTLGARWSLTGRREKGEGRREGVGCLFLGG
ncbi:hypothetical protein IE53DRAFT_139844 [Violaceomyces palustris]|uniref:Uncharacterized protein n=1 Tax=Violaceomyces palustris TaxID=1673888 RepID=A0ACD0NUK2_9BASI|nr:hypothetical protein IE53DRAFT_139844 [Violaceomyces palustris]